MNQYDPVLVIGANGNVGRHVVSQLLDTGARVRALTRDPDAARLPDGAEVVRGDLFEPESLDAPLEGVQSVFLVFPSVQADEVAPAVVARIAKYAQHIVYLSAEGVPDDPAQPSSGIIGSHALLERLIEESGVRWTFLRSGGMAVNTLGWAEQIRSHSVVRWPYAAAARSLVHEADLAAVAVQVLTTEGHVGEKYVVTGPAVLTQSEQARVIGDAIGRPVRYEELPREQARTQLIEEWGWPAEMTDGALDAWASMVGSREGVTSSVERLTGRSARTFRQWAADHADDFR